MKPAFAVLNPGGRDPAQIFPHGPGSPTDAGHPPINYHAYAACCEGGFFRKVAEIPASVQAVLVLLRSNGLGDAQRAVRELKKSGRRTLVSWKESGLHQVATALSDVNRYETFRAIELGHDCFAKQAVAMAPGGLRRDDAAGAAGRVLAASSDGCDPPESGTGAAA